MTNEIISIIKDFSSFIVAILCAKLSKDRAESNKLYAKKHATNKKLLIRRLIITLLLKVITIVLVLNPFIHLCDPFVGFYIFTPLLIAFHLVFLGNTNKIWGFMSLIKGGYYLGLSIIATVQFVYDIDDPAKIALGFTLSLAIFESVSAIHDGLAKISHEKNQ